MRIILATLGIAILLPFSDASLGGEKDHGRILASACERSCELDRCTDRAEEVMFRSAENAAQGKWNWCVEQDGDFDKKAKLGLCGDTLVEKPKYDCEKFANCVDDNHCRYYRKGRSVCTSSESALKADWALDMCKSQEYAKANQWAGPCPISSFPYKEMEYDCKSFEECVKDHHCDQYDSWNCGQSESRSKAEWARSTCDKGQFKAANWWTDDCDIKNFKVDSTTEVCDAYYDCMLDAMYDEMVESKSDILVDQCVDNNNYRSTCRDECWQGCDSDPCEHGTCTNKSGGKYSCKCDAGYEGKNCEKNINDCRFSPCGAHGTCYDKVNGYYCDCEDGWEGDQCSQMANMCKPTNPCKNGGKCKNLGNGKYECDCLSGFSGYNCQHNDNECATQPCRNGAICIDKVNDYECKCKPGHSGKRCERNCVQCSNNPTQWMKENGRTCDDWTWGIPRKCKDTWWLNNQWCEEACAKAGAPYPDSYRCCGVVYDNRVPSQCSNLSVDQAQVCLFSKKGSRESCRGCCQYMCDQLANPCDDCVDECIGDNADCCQIWENECGIGGETCPDNECCSKYGFCGKTNAYCGQCCQGDRKGDQCSRSDSFRLDLDPWVDPESSDDPKSSDDPMPVKGWDKFDAACRLANGSGGDRGSDFDQYDDWDFEDCRKECDDKAKCEAFEYRFSRRECELWWVYPWKESHKSDYACWKKE